MEIKIYVQGRKGRNQKDLGVGVHAWQGFFLFLGGLVG